MNFRNIEEDSFNFGKTSVHTSKLHLLKVFELYITIVLLLGHFKFN